MVSSQGTGQAAGRGRSADRRDGPAASRTAAQPQEVREAGDAPDETGDRQVRRARFLAELAEARALRRRVAPRRARAAEIHERLLRTFRY
jgi:hypothetical protein